MSISISTNAHMDVATTCYSVTYNVASYNMTVHQGPPNSPTIHQLQVLRSACA
jgi:hypothetical protein